MAIMDGRSKQGTEAGSAQAYDNDTYDTECEVIKTGDFISPREASPGIQVPKQEEEDEEEYDENMEKKIKRKEMKERVKTAVAKTGKVVTSSYTCGICISISGMVTMICGIIMIAIGNNPEQAGQDESSKNFLLIGGSIFFIFGLAMLAAALIYVIVHFLRKRAKEKKDPFQLKAQEKERKEREKAVKEGRIVEPAPAKIPPSQIPSCSAEFEHDNVTEKRIKEARRQSLFTASSATQGDVTSISTPPLKKSQSAFELKGGPRKPNKLPPIQSESNVIAMGGASPLPPIKKGGAIFELDELETNSPRTNKNKKTNMSRAFNDGSFHRSKSAAQFTETEVFDMKGMGNESGLGPLPPLAGARRNSAFELGQAGKVKSNKGMSHVPSLHAIDDVTDFDSDI